MADMTLGCGWYEAEILHHGLRLQGYKLSPNHTSVQLLDGEYQVPIATPDDGAEFERVFPYYTFFRNELFRNFTLQRYKSFLIWQNIYLGVSPLSGSPNAGGPPPSFYVSGVATDPW